MYKPSYLFQRTPEERRDPFLFWQRKDQPFFAAGACHILAEMFVRLHAHEGFKMIFIKPAEDFSGAHVYASNGTWAFDHNGWTKEKELLTTTEKAYSQRYPGWKYERIVIKWEIDSFEKFCKASKHQLPWQFAYLPWERAYNYINKFPASPPS